MNDTVTREPDPIDVVPGGAVVERARRRARIAAAFTPTRPGRHRTVEPAAATDPLPLSAVAMAAHHVPGDFR